MSDFNAVNAIYGSYFTPDSYPSRAAFAVAELPKSCLVEIEVCCAYGDRALKPKLWTNLMNSNLLKQYKIYSVFKSYLILYILWDSLKHFKSNIKVKFSFILSLYIFYYLF